MKLRRRKYEGSFRDAHKSQMVIVHRRRSPKARLLMSDKVWYGIDTVTYNEDGNLRIVFKMAARNLINNIGKSLERSGFCSWFSIKEREEPFRTRYVGGGHDLILYEFSSQGMSLSTLSKYVKQVFSADNYLAREIDLSQVMNLTKEEAYSCYNTVRRQWLKERHEERESRDVDKGVEVISNDYHEQTTFF